MYVDLERWIKFNVYICPIIYFLEVMLDAARGEKTGISLVFIQLFGF